MLSLIAKHIAKNNIVIIEQHGFRKKLFTITQLINTTTHWANTLNNKGQTDIIFLTSVKHLTKYHINLSYPSFTTMVFEITLAHFHLTVLKQQLLMMFIPTMLKLLLECHKDLF